jgi:hypothetical protein
VTNSDEMNQMNEKPPHETKEMRRQQFEVFPASNTTIMNITMTWFVQMFLK